MRDKRRDTALLCGMNLYFLALSLVLIFGIRPNFDQWLIIKSWRPYFVIGSYADTPIAYLNRDLSFFFAETWQKAKRFKDFTGPFLTDFAWASLPIALLMLHTNYIESFKALKKSEPFLFLASVASFIAPFLLFCFQDWGRWIYLISVHTFISLVMLNNFKFSASRKIFYSAIQWRICVLFLLFYAILFRMPAFR